MEVSHDQIALVAGALFVLIEFWLGKTEKVESGSTLELVLNAAKAVLKVLKGEDKQGV